MLSLSLSERLRQSLARWFSFFVPAFLLLLVFVGADAMPEYSTDTYHTLSFPLTAASDMLLRNARPVIALLYALILPRFASSPALVYGLSYWCGVFLLSISVSILALLVDRVSARRFPLLSLLAAFTACVTIFSIDFFMYLETTGFICGIGFAVLSLYWLDRAAAVRRPCLLFPALLFLILSVFSYQSTAAIFVFVGLPLFIYRAQGSFRRFLLLNFTAAGLYAAANAANILLLHFAGSSRMVSFHLSDLRLVRLSVQYALQYDYFLLPEHALSWCLWAMLLLCVIASLFTRRSALLHLLELVYICGVIYLHSFLMMLISYDAPRIQYPLGSVFGVLLIHFLINIRPELPVRTGRLFAAAFAFPIFALLCLQFSAFQQTIFVRYKTNAWDEYQIRMIGQHIADYEAESGETIRSVAFYTDQSSAARYAFDSTLSSSGRALSAEWSRLSAVNHYLHVDYAQAPQSESYRDAFSRQDWDFFSPEQLIFEGDTLHLCVY